MAELTIKKKRPKHLDVTKIRLPLPGILSILHRVSGAGLFLLLPLLLWLFQCSVDSPESFGTFKAVVSFSLVKLVLLGLIWAFCHHFCAGIRFLFLDMHVGVDLPSARLTSKIAFVVSLALTVLLGAKLLW